MQTTSALYNSILASDNHWFETRLIIDGVGTFGETQLFSVSTSSAMFGNEPTIGMAAAAEINVRMVKPSAQIPRVAKLRPQVRVTNGAQTSEWLPQGIFYIDTRDTIKGYNGEDVLAIHGYDAMLKAEQMFEDDGTLNWSNPNGVIDSVMAAYIAGKMGVSLDPRNSQVWAGYRYYVPLPVGYTYREILGYIASFYVGCFVITEEGKLRLVGMTGLPRQTNYLITNEGSPITFGGTRILV